MESSGLGADSMKQSVILEDKKLPHSDVYTRLGCSQIHGVGVFAIRDIPANMNIFGDDPDEVFLVDKSVVEAQDEENRKLYYDFSAIEDGRYCCPESFNRMTVCWYFNESKSPNTRSNGHEFYALRDIKKGEELTVDYSTFSEEAENV
jgi:SET domain-containing protein